MNMQFLIALALWSGIAFAQNSSNQNATLPHKSTQAQKPASVQTTPAPVPAGSPTRIGPNEACPQIAAATSSAVEQGATVPYQDVPSQGAPNVQPTGSAVSAAIEGIASGACANSSRK